MGRWGASDDDADLVSPVPPSEAVDDDYDVLELGDRRPVPSWVIVVGIGVLIGAVLIVSAVKRSDHHSAAPLPTVSSPAGATPVAGLGPAVDLGETTAVDLAMARGL